MPGQFGEFLRQAWPNGGWHPGLPGNRGSVGIALDIARRTRNMHAIDRFSTALRVIRHAMNLKTVASDAVTGHIRALIPGRAPAGLRAFAN